MLLRQARTQRQRHCTGCVCPRPRRCRIKCIAQQNTYSLYQAKRYCHLISPRGCLRPRTCAAYRGSAHSTTQQYWLRSTTQQYQLLHTVLRNSTGSVVLRNNSTGSLRPFSNSTDCTAPVHPQLSELQQLLGPNETVTLQLKCRAIHGLPADTAQNVLGTCFLLLTHTLSEHGPYRRIYFYQRAEEVGSYCYRLRRARAYGIAYAAAAPQAVLSYCMVLRHERTAIAYGAIILRVCYAVSGTDIAYGQAGGRVGGARGIRTKGHAHGRRPAGTRVVRAGRLLGYAPTRWVYVVIGTDIAYAAMRCAVLRQLMVLQCYAVCGTESVRYGATRTGGAHVRPETYPLVPLFAQLLHS
eukprot:1373058-Rhodomonas_salina.1